MRTRFAIVKLKATGHNIILGIPFIKITKVILIYNVLIGAIPLAELIIRSSKLRVPIILN